MKGHSVKTSLPPLPKNGPTCKTVAQKLDIRGVDNSPVPSTTTSLDKENDVTTEVTEDQLVAAAAGGKCTRKRPRLVISSSSSPANDTELRDNATSSSPPCHY